MDYTANKYFDLLLSAEIYQYKISIDGFKYILLGIVVCYRFDWLGKPRLSDDQLEQKYKIREIYQRDIRVISITSLEVKYFR